MPREALAGIAASLPATGKATPSTPEATAAQAQAKERLPSRRRTIAAANR